MADAFIFQAALYCDDCGERIRAELTADGKAPADIENESSYDSDEFPKGPYSDAGGESDSPEHCAGCHVFLDNSLTDAGVEYVLEHLESEAADLTAANRIMPAPGTAEDSDDFRYWHGSPHKAIVREWWEPVRWYGLTDAQQARLDRCAELLEFE